MVLVVNTQYTGSGQSPTCRFYAVMDSPNYFLSEEEQQVAAESVHGFLESYSWLNQWALDTNRMRWPITIKFHYFKH